MEVLYDRVAGLDIGKKTLTVCVRTPDPRGRRSETPTFKTTVANALASEFTAANTQEIRDAFVAEYQSEWQQKIALGTYTDTAANRRAFVADKIVDYIADVRRANDRKTKINAITTPTPLSEE